MRLSHRQERPSDRNKSIIAAAKMKAHNRSVNLNTCPRPNSRARTANRMYFLGPCAKKVTGRPRGNYLEHESRGLSEIGQPARRSVKKAAGANMTASRAGTTWRDRRARQPMRRRCRPGGRRQRVDRARRRIRPGSRHRPKSGRTAPRLQALRQRPCDRLGVGKAQAGEIGLRHGDQFFVRVKTDDGGGQTRDQGRRIARSASDNQHAVGSSANAPP